MNIIEVMKEKNVDKKYTVNHNGEEMIVRVIKCCGDSYDLVEVIRDDERGYMDRYLSSFMYMSEIANLEFKEVFDWSKIPVDTKVLVSRNGKDWHRRYFVKFKKGMVYCFDGGATSFSIEDGDCDITGWEYAKLYQE